MSDKKEQVIKIGGAHLDDEAHLEALFELVRSQNDDERRVILVHGGGKEIGRMHARLDVPYYKDGGLRVTSDESMPIVSMVLCGLVNKRIVARFRGLGLRAVGVSGADLGMRSPFLSESRLGRVGGPPRADVEATRSLLEPVDVLVVAPVCLAPDGGLINVNADTVAQTIATALSVSCLDFVTDVEAVRGQSGAIGRLQVEDVGALMEKSVVTGGMIPKLQSAVAAIDGGVQRVRVGSLASLARGTATEVYA